MKFGPEESDHRKDTWMRDLQAMVDDAFRTTQPLNGEATGIKYDANKPRWDLLPFEAVELVVEVLTSGAVKYDDHNWKRLPDAKNRYFAAMMRHIVAYKKGERFDESGSSHLAHAAACMIFLLHKTEIEKNER